MEEEFEYEYVYDTEDTDVKGPKVIFHIFEKKTYLIYIIFQILTPLMLKNNVDIEENRYILRKILRRRKQNLEPYYNQTFKRIVKEKVSDKLQNIFFDN